MLKSMKKQARITAESHSLKYYAEKILDVYNCAIGTEKKTGMIRKFLDQLKG